MIDRNWKCLCGNRFQLGRDTIICPRCKRRIPWETASILVHGWVKKGEERGSREITEFCVFYAGGTASDDSGKIPLSNPTGGDWGGQDNHYYIRGDAYDHFNPPLTPPQTGGNRAAVDALREELTTRQGYEVYIYPNPTTPNPRFGEEWFKYGFRRLAKVYDDMSEEQVQETVDTLTTRANSGRGEDLDTARQLCKLAKIITDRGENNRAAKAIDCLIAADAIYRQYGEYDSGLACLEQAAQIKAKASPNSAMGSSNPYVKMVEERRTEGQRQKGREEEKKQERRQKYYGCPLDSSDAVEKVSHCGNDPQLRRRLAPPRRPGIRGFFSKDEKALWTVTLDPRGEDPQWLSALSTWYEDLYYCPRHDVVYLAGSSRPPVPPKQMRKLLYS